MKGTFVLNEMYDARPQLRYRAELTSNRQPTHFVDGDLQVSQAYSKLHPSILK